MKVLNVDFTPSDSRDQTHFSLYKLKDVKRETSESIHVMFALHLNNKILIESYSIFYLQVILLAPTKYNLLAFINT